MALSGLIPSLEQKSRAADWRGFSLFDAEICASIGGGGAFEYLGAMKQVPAFRLAGLAFSGLARLGGAPAVNPPRC